jgi:hypothetical protein
VGVNGTSGILQVLRYVGVPYGVEPNCRCREREATCCKFNETSRHG